MTDGSATIGAMLRAGLSDVRGAARDCWVALVVAAAVSVAADGLPPGVKILGVLLPIVIAQGALFRRAFGREAGLKGLRWGRDEWRLLAAQVMIWALLFLIGAILMVIVGGVSLGVARTAAPDFDPGTVAGWRGAFASAGPAGLVLALVPLASIAILIWLSLRLSLSAPATVDQAGVRVLSAFPLTKGRTPTLFVVGLAIAIPLFALSVVLKLAPGQGLVVAAILALATYFYLMPAWAGALAHFYRANAVMQDA
jgi:hypothetical protein